MAVAGTLTYEAVFDDKGVLKGLSSVEKEAEKSAGVFEVAMGNIVANLASVAVDGLKEITMAGIDYNAQMESYETSFKVMLGSQEEAVNLMSQLQEVGAKTPFELSDLANASQQLLAYGQSSENLIPVMSQLGDISLGNKDKFDSLVNAYGKMNSSGKVSLEYLNMMIEQGFNPLSIIAEETGSTMEEMYDKVSKGEVSFEQVQGAIESATSKGGQFYEGMAEQSETFNGQISTLKDNFNIFLGETMQPFFDFLSETALPIINDLLSGGEKFSAWFKENEQPVTLLAIAIGTLTFAIITYNLSLHATAIATAIVTTATSIFGAVLAFVTSPITLVILAIGLLIAIIYLLVKNWDTVSETAVKVWEKIQETFSEVASWFKENVIDPVSNFFKSMWDNIIGFFRSAWDKIKSIFSKGGEIFGGVVDGISSIFTKAVNFLIKGINTVISKPLNFLNSILNKIRNIEIAGFTPFDDLFSRNPISIPKIPLLAKGGVVSKSTLAMIGEDGSEAVIPLENNTDWTNKVASLMIEAIGKQTTTYSNGKIGSSYNGIGNQNEEYICIENPTYLDGEVLYKSNQKIALRKQLGGA